MNDTILLAQVNHTDTLSPDFRNKDPYEATRVVLYFLLSVIIGILLYVIFKLLTLDRPPTVQRFELTWLEELLLGDEIRRPRPLHHRHRHRHRSYRKTQVPSRKIVREEERATNTTTTTTHPVIETCTICLDRQVTCVAVPCGHYITCAACARQLVHMHKHHSLTKCPLCSQEMSTVMRTYK